MNNLNPKSINFINELKAEANQRVRRNDQKDACHLHMLQIYSRLSLVSLSTYKYFNKKKTMNVTLVSVCFFIILDTNV